MIRGKLNRECIIVGYVILSFVFKFFQLWRSTKFPKASEMEFIRSNNPSPKNGNRLKSPACDTWNWIIDEDGGKIDGKIACIYCYTVQDYSSTMGTTNLLAHKDECLNTEKRKSLSSLSRNEIKTIKSSVNEKVV